MKTSDRGRAALELEEGVVLRAYRDVAGVWTIGAGLTAASGVVKPMAGMVISRKEADRLLAAALGRYEREVEVAMSNVAGSTVVRPSQSAFDAGVSFHWNTGAIAKASWVDKWRAKARDLDVESAMLLWAKAGGKVLPALQSRRKREAAMLLRGIYRVPATVSKPNASYARWGLTLATSEQRAVFDGLHKLGYDPGAGGDLVALTAATAFQKDHGLTADGIIGRATLSTLQRALDMRPAVGLPLAVNALTAVAVASGVFDQITAVPQIETVGWMGAAAWLLGKAWTYRDAIAGTLGPELPKFAAFLRSR